MIRSVNTVVAVVVVIVVIVVVIVVASSGDSDDELWYLSFQKCRSMRDYATVITTAHNKHIGRVVDDNAILLEQQHKLLQVSSLVVV